MTTMITKMIIMVCGAEEISTKTRIWVDGYHYRNYHHLIVVVIDIDIYIPNDNYVLIMDLMVKMMKRGDAC